MVMNIVDAETFLDKMASDDVDFLLAARQGIALTDIPDVTLKHLMDEDLVQIVPFDNPRATNAIKGVIVTENGTKVLNVIDSRRWAESEHPIWDQPADAEPEVDAVVKAQSTRKDKADNKSGSIPANSPQNKDYDNKK